MKNILITGGPVHAHLDAVKIITNNFKGGFMVELATNLSTDFDANVTYLCNKAAKIPAGNPRLKVIYHNGFEDYKNKVLEMAPQMDAVILGAAVANLIPYKPIEGKFPSHNYKPGDLVPLIFQIAPRVIDEVKKVAPKTHLFGFKLLDGVDQAELNRAAYGVLLESHATAVIANDKQNLEQKYIVTKERAVHPLKHEELAGWLWKAINDQYYKTVVHTMDKSNTIDRDPFHSNFFEFKKFMDEKGKWGGFYESPEGYVFGTVAKRCDKGFWTTGRGKKESDSFIFVDWVNHIERTVFTLNAKATLNAPLLSNIFLTLTEVDIIAHSHYIPTKFSRLGLPVYEYAPPGTVRDTDRKIKTSFIIENHGLFLLYNKEGTLI